MRQLTKGLLLLAAIAALMMTACGTPISEAEAVDLLQPLIVSSHDLNVIYFGEGLPAATDEELLAAADEDALSRLQATNASYAAVSADSPYQTLDALKTATAAVFSDDYCQDLYALAFEGVAEEFEDSAELETAYVYARYIENYGVLTTARDYDAFYTGRTYDFSTLTVETSGADYLSVRIDTTSPDGSVINVRIQAVKEPEGWRLNSPTY